MSTVTVKLWDKKTPIESAFHVNMPRVPFAGEKLPVKFVPSEGQTHGESVLFKVEHIMWPVTLYSGTTFGSQHEPPIVVMQRCS